MDVRTLRLALTVALILVLGSLQAAGAQEAPAGDDDFNKGGRTGLQFLKIGLGARQTALGEAGIAAVQDVNAVFWNPANLRGVASFEASFSYNRWLADLNYVAGAVGAHWEGIGVFALSVASLDYGDLQEALVTGPSNDTRTGATFSGSDLMAGLSYARAFTDRLSIGLTAKYVHESLWNHSVGTVAFDVGTLYDVGYRGIRLAMSVQNFAGSVRWLDDSDRETGYDLPLVFRIGAATNLVGEDAFFNAGPAHRVVFSVEAINTNDFSERLHLGGEYWFSDFLALRGGYRLNYAEGNWSFGFGLNPAVSGVALRLDYAYVDYKFLNAPHRFTVTLAF
jgi:hypothetical protein